MIEIQEMKRFLAIDGPSKSNRQLHEADVEHLEALKQLVQQKMESSKELALRAHKTMHRGGGNKKSFFRHGTVIRTKDPSTPEMRHKAKKAMRRLKRETWIDTSPAEKTTTLGQKREAYQRGKRLMGVAKHAKKHGRVADRMSREIDQGRVPKSYFQSYLHHSAERMRASDILHKHRQRKAGKPIVPGRQLKVSWKKSEAYDRAGRVLNIYRTMKRAQVSSKPGMPDRKKSAARFYKAKRIIDKRRGKSESSGRVTGRPSGDWRSLSQKWRKHSEKIDWKSFDKKMRAAGRASAKKDKRRGKSEDGAYYNRVSQ